MKIKVAIEFEVDLPDIQPNTAEYLYEDRIEDIVCTINEDIKNKHIKGTGHYTYVPEDDKDYDNGALY